MMDARLGDISIKFGDTGDLVEEIQELLFEGDYFGDAEKDIVVDGVFGLATMEAVQSFQVANKLQETGWVDLAMLNLLRGEAEVRKVVKTAKGPRVKKVVEPITPPVDPEVQPGDGENHPKETGSEQTKASGS